jgi:dimeric dUTPase (all-alpha-NTP-PPase superfamily)
MTKREWASHRKMEIHPKTGAAQMVEISELVKKIEILKYIEKEQPKPDERPVFENFSDEKILFYGVPQE